MKKTIVIMAAGMGSRYGGLKQIDAMGPKGEILMEYSVYDALQSGFEKVVFIIKETMHADFHQKIGSRLSKHIEVDYAFQKLEDIPEGYQVPDGREKPWGTSHAILAAKENVNTPFAVFNADDFYGAQAFQRMAEHLDSVNTEMLESSMVGYQIQKTLSPHGTVTRGICQTDKGYLTGVKEIARIGYNEQEEIVYFEGDKTYPLDGTALCSMNFWGFTPQLFTYLEKDFTRFLDEKGKEIKSEWLIPTTVDDMIQAGLTKVKVLESGDSWFGVTYPDDKPQVIQRIQDLIDSGCYPSPLFPEAE